ncbi:serine/arginine-rich splicing factor 7-like, partial [Bombus pyrosoma]|uniref:serine/arginine-rich splicing factor 7-like n=1 Tax=Bombus pyrosoma TaxID=396416 RepID=UPI001CB9BBF3
TLPDKKMPSYTHLVEFLKTRTNGDRTSPTTTTKKTSEKHNRQRQHAPRSITFATTHRPTACPSCKGQHKIWHCDVFKAKSVKNRLEIVKRASLCTNCLGQGHTIAQCSAGPCRICRQRHHTYLHQHQRHGKSRSSSGRSSSDRSSGGRSSLSSPTPRSSHRSRRASTSSKSSHRSSSRSSSKSSPRSSPRTSPKHEPRPTRTHTTGSKSSSSPQRQERK